MTHKKTDVNQATVWSDFKWLYIDIPESTRKWVKSVK